MYEISESMHHPPFPLPLPISMPNSSEEPKKNPMKPHGCSRCSKSFTSVHQLAQHTRVHTGEKPYKCSFCEKRFKQQSHVKQHTRLHTGERPYKCSEPTCGRSFIQLSNLQQHMSQHVKDPIKAEKNTNFNCVTCGKFFASDSSLALHQEKKHKELVGEIQHRLMPKVKPFLCAVCNKSYTTESALQIHTAKHRTSDSDGSSSSRSIIETVESPPSSVCCQHCPETFISTEGLIEHMKVAHELFKDPLRYPHLPYSSIPLPFTVSGPTPTSQAHHWFDPSSIPFPHCPPPPPSSFHKSHNKNHALKQ